MKRPRFPRLIQPHEGRRLRDLAEGVRPPQAIVELGSHTGLSTCWMAGETQAHVFAIDPWGDPRPGSDDDPLRLGTGDATLERFLHNVAGMGYGGRITPIRGRSIDIAPFWVQPVGLLFVDAVHEYDAVRDDILAWAPLVVAGGWIAFHDWTDDPSHHYAGVKLAIDDHLGPGWSPAPVVGNLWTAQRLTPRIPGG